MFLATLLHTSEQAAAAMFSSVENRAAQLRMIDGCAKAVLPSDHYDAISVLLSAEIRPCMKERDKLAHWCWGLSDELPDALLISHPTFHTRQGLMAIKAQLQDRDATPDVRGDFNEIFVVKANDLERTLLRFQSARLHLRMAGGSVWMASSEAERAEVLRQLSNTPVIRSGLARLAENRQKTPATPQPSPPPNQSGEA
jgi:hypothetical protein